MRSTLTNYDTKEHKTQPVRELIEIQAIGMACTTSSVAYISVRIMHTFIVEIYDGITLRHYQNTASHL